MMFIANRNLLAREQKRREKRQAAKSPQVYMPPAPRKGRRR